MSPDAAGGDTDDVCPSDSVSQVSLSSLTLRLELIRQQAQLKAQLALRKEQHDLQLEQLRPHRRCDDLESHTKMLALDEEENIMLSLLVKHPT